MFVDLWHACNVEKCLFTEIVFGMYNLDNYDIYIHWRDIALATCSHSQTLLNMNIEENFEATLWRHRWRHHHQKTFLASKHEYRGKLWGHHVTSSMTSSPWKHFFGIIWDDLFISEVKLKLCLIFQNFQNGRHVELAHTFFFTKSYTGSWIDQKDSHEHFWHFELLIDALAQILTEIYQFQNLTYFVILWRHQWRHECVKHNLHN